MKTLYIDLCDGTLIEMPQDMREEAKFRKFLFERFHKFKLVRIIDEKDNLIDILTLEELFGN